MVSSIRSMVVTGSNQGPGMHAVHQLVATPNVLVFMGSRKPAAAEEALAKFASDMHSSSAVISVQLDITDDESIKNAHQLTVKTLQEKGLAGPDVLVNNAARDGTFEEVYAVNNGGAILNISSGLGSLDWHTERPPLPRYPAYSSSKAVLNHLTVQWSILEEQKRSGIRVVSICPAYNATNLNNYQGIVRPADVEWE